MQTFLPYPNFDRSAECLDRQRLGKQRVEARQLLDTLNGNTKGWRNHPAAKMWAGYELALSFYGLAICDEWIKRGYQDAQRPIFIKSIQAELGWSWNPSPYDTDNSVMTKMPPWHGDEKFHASHRSNLLRKLPSHYSQFGWTEPNDLPYVWPK